MEELGLLEIEDSLGHLVKYLNHHECLSALFLVMAKVPRW